MELKEHRTCECPITLIPLCHRTLSLLTGRSVWNFYKEIMPRVGFSPARTGCSFIEKGPNCK